MLKPLLRTIDNISDWSGKILGFIIYFGIFVLIYEVVARYIFNAPTLWAHGMGQRFFGAFYILGGAYALRWGAHIGMDVVYSRFSLRTRKILDLITSPFLFACCIVLIWQGWSFAWVSLRNLEACNTPFHAPVYPAKLTIPLAGLLLLLQTSARFTRDLITAISGRQCEY